MSWYPRTADEVMNLPIRPDPYRQIDCPNCHHTINVREQPKYEHRSIEPDAVFFVTAPDGTWEAVEIEGVWYRKEFMRL